MHRKISAVHKNTLTRKNRLNEVSTLTAKLHSGGRPYKEKTACFQENIPPKQNYEKHSTQSCRATS